MAGDVTIELLGGFTVCIGDRVVTAADFERRSGAELVQRLALAPGRRLHREQLIEQLWPDLPLTSATNQFHKASSFARGGLGDRKAIIIRDEFVHLFRDAEVTLDVDVVEQAEIADPDSITAAKRAYRGDLLPETPYADWAVERRDQIKYAFLRLLEGAADWDEIARLDPCHETAQVELMRRSLEAGDRAAVVRRYDEFAARLREYLGLDPGPDAVALRDRALEAAALADSAPTAAAGRADESEQVLALLDAARFVTIAGPGGIGKTHLAISLAERITAAGRRVVIGSLGRVDDAAGVAQELLAVLGTRRHTDTDDLQSVLRTIGDEDAVIVLDNCEHILAGARTLVAAIMADCPNARVLATSRLPVDVDGEHVVRLGPLARSASRELFATEAARHDVVLVAGDGRVDRICELVDDLPLAVRLAAARTRSADLDALVAALTDGLAMIGDDTAAGHDRTLREAVAWSLDALSPVSRTALAALSAFADRFDLAGARSVTAIDDIAQLLDVLDDLVAASLVAVERPGGEARYRLLEAIRYFARDDGLDDDVRRRHLGHVRHRAEAADALMDDDSSASFDAFEAIWPDIRFAIGTATDLGLQHDAVAIIAACSTFANLRLAFDVLEWCDRVLDATEPASDALHAHALATWASILVHRDELDRAAAILGLIGDDYLDEPAVLYARGWIPWSAADIPASRALFDRILEHPAVPAKIEAGTLALQSIILWAQGDDVSALAHRADILAAGRGPVYEVEALLCAGIDAIWTDPDVALDRLARASDIAARVDIMTVGGAARAAQAVALSLHRTPQEALSVVRDNLGWTLRHGIWSFAMAGLATAALLFDGLGRTDLAVSIASARVSNGFVSGFNAESIKAMTERARVAHPDRFDAWWAAGLRLDPQATTTFGINAIDQIVGDTA